MAYRMASIMVMQDIYYSFICCTALRKHQNILPFISFPCNEMVLWTETEISHTTQSHNHRWNHQKQDTFYSGFKHLNFHFHFLWFPDFEMCFTSKLHHRSWRICHQGSIQQRMFRFQTIETNSLYELQSYNPSQHMNIHQTHPDISKNILLWYLIKMQLLHLFNIKCKTKKESMKLQNTEKLREFVNIGSKSV